MRSFVVAIVLLSSYALCIPVPFEQVPVSKFFGYTAADGFNLTALDEYVAKPDSNYAWTKLSEEISGPGWKGTILNVTSQRWLSDADTTCSLWFHTVVVIVPIDLLITDRAVMYITGGSNGDHIPKAKDEDVALTAALALAAGTVAVTLFQIPNEPCYFSNDPLNVPHPDEKLAEGEIPRTKRRSEDGVIALTWYRYINNVSNPEWLLRLPMTKAVVRVMDAVTEYVEQTMHHSITGFAIAGASKRGWTTWTTAAVDKRVIAAIPLVMSALNFVKNIHHYFRAYGGWTFAFNDYYEMNFTQNLDNPNVQKMAEIIDPYVYRMRYQMPFMLVSTTGDEFFLPDDTQYFWDEMPATKHFLIAHNAEHSCATGIPQIVPAIAGFINSILSHKKLPVMNWTISDDGTIHLITDMKPSSVVVHWADTLSTTRRDFRLATGDKPCPWIPAKGICLQPIIWFSEKPTVVSDTEYTVNMGTPKKGWRAFFMEVHFDTQTLFKNVQTTQVSILPKTLPFPDCHGDECKGVLL